MPNRLLIKSAVVTLLMALLLLSLSLIQSTIDERAHTRDDAQHEVAQSAAGEQLLTGPLLLLPYQVTDDTGKVLREGVQYALPRQLQVQSPDLGYELRQRGIFPVLLFHGRISHLGSFQVLPHAGLVLAPNEKFLPGQPYLSVGLSDVRGLLNTPQLGWNRQAIAFTPGSRFGMFGPGVHADLPAEIENSGGVFQFSYTFELFGSGAVSWLPLGAETHVQLGSKWQYPQFFGNALPTSRYLAGSGFNARWDTSDLATAMPEHMAHAWATLGNADSNNPLTVARLQSAPRNQELFDSAVGVRFVQPVDAYVQSSRAVKYGMLFIMLTFTAFALFEILKSLPIHPVQYALVGAALALFFLLLLALSEHLAFAWSYLIASSACVGLLGFYLSHVLGAIRRGLSFAMALGLVYAMLYLVLQSEDAALLLGALLLFAVLALIMASTRKLDWYQVTRNLSNVQ